MENQNDTLESIFEQKYTLKSVFEKAYGKRPKKNDKGNSYSEANIRTELTKILKGLYCCVHNTTKEPDRLPAIKKNSHEKINLITKCFLMVLLSQPSGKGTFISKIKTKKVDKITAEEKKDFLTAVYDELCDNINNIDLCREISDYQARIFTDIETDEFEKENFKKEKMRFMHSIDEYINNAVDDLEKHNNSWNLIVPRAYLDDLLGIKRSENAIDLFFSTSDSNSNPDFLNFIQQKCAIKALEKRILNTVDEWKQNLPEEIAEQMKSFYAGYRN